MSLSSCTKCKDIPKFFGILEIGVASASTAYRVYFTNLATGIESIYDVTSESDGRVLIRQVADDFQLAGGWYEVEVVDASRYYIGEQASISIDGTSYSCFRVRLVDVVATDGDQELYEYIKLQVA